jgi:hypothetical protein
VGSVLPGTSTAADDYRICRACWEAGVEGAIERSNTHAARLEKWAQFQREVIPNILRMVSDWKTGKDYDDVIQAFEQELSNSLSEAEKKSQILVPVEKIDDEISFYPMTNTSP